MLRVSSQRFHCQIILRMLALLLLTSLVAYGQSLGDVARENREKKAADTSTTPPKVITNRNLPKDPDGYTGPRENESEAQTARANAAADQHAAEQRAAEQQAAEQWKRRILAQEGRVASLQARVANLKAAMHLAGEDVSDGMPYNRYQARQLGHLTQMQLQLDQQKRKLEYLQDAARHAGMHTTVYDP